MREKEGGEKKELRRKDMRRESGKGRNYHLGKE